MVGGIIVLVILCGTWIVGRIFDYKKKSLTIPMNNGGKKGKSFSDMLDNLPQALKYANQIYDEQLKICNEKGMTEEQMIPILKPLKDRIDFLRTVEKYEPIARVGADIADVGAASVKKIVKELGNA